MEPIKQSILRSRAATFKRLREGFMNQIYPVVSGPTTKRQLIVGNPDATSLQLLGLQALGDVVGSVNRMAGNHQTAFEGGGSSAGGGASASPATRQVERALSQVLGRAPGRSGESFMLALREAFPLKKYGQEISSAPTRSVVSLAGSDGASSGLGGQLSAPQAALYRHAGIIAADATKILAGLQAFVPTADAEPVEALRARIRAQIQALADEFGRIDEPRAPRVNAYFAMLDLHLAELDRRAQFSSCDDIITVGDEKQSSSYHLLVSYVRALRAAWCRYVDESNDQRCRDSCVSFSKRLERANILLPIVAQATRDLENAFDSVNFSEAERRSDATRFNQLADFQASAFPYPSYIYGAIQPGTSSGPVRSLSPFLNFNAGARKGTPSNQNEISGWLPGFTVSDLTSWLDQFANTEGPAALGDSGIYGLDFVTDQADRLFWAVAPVIAFLRTTTPANLVTRSTLGQVLSNERVSWSLDNLLAQLDALADLAMDTGAGARR